MFKIKIAIFSDIHGNLIALEEAIKDAKAQNVDTFVVTGDIIGDFPMTNEVISIVKELTPFVIKGNREQYVIDYHMNKENERWENIQNNPIKFIYQELDTENLEYIIGLDETKAINLEGLAIKLVHGSPDKMTEMISLEDDHRIHEIKENLTEDILIFGHTHKKPNFRYAEDKLMITAGTLGVHNNNKNAQYLILEYEPGNTKVENANLVTRTICYDKEKLKKGILQSGILDIAPTWVNLSYFTILNGKEDLNEIFVDEALQKMKEREKSDGVFKAWNSIDDDIWNSLHEKYSEKYNFLKPI